VDVWATARYSLALGVLLPWCAASAQVPATQPRPDTGAAAGLAQDTTLPYAAVLTMDTIVVRAQHYSPNVVGAYQQLRTGQSGVRVAYGNYLPAVTGFGSAVQSNQQNTPGLANSCSPNVRCQPQSYGGGLAASYDVFTGFRRGADLAAAKATTRSADASLIEQRFATMLTAKTTAYGVERGRDLVRAALKNLATAQTSLTYTQAQLRSGTATRSDLLASQLNVTTARQQLIASRDTLTTYAYALGRLVGIDGAVGVTDDALPDSTLALGDSAIIQLAVNAAPSVLSSDEQARADDALLRATKSEYSPDIKLTGAYTWANQSYTDGANREGWSVALGTSFPLFNGFQREDDVTRASATAITAHSQAADARRFARAEAERLLADVHFAAQNVTEAEEAVRVADEGLRVTQVRFRNGVSTFLDLNTAETNSVNADVSLVTARYTYQISRASLEALLGRTL
jgi:outer membrane protein